MRYAAPRPSAGKRIPRLAILLVILAVLVVVLIQRRHSSPATGGLDRATVHRLAAELGALEARENHIAETVWAPELLAQQCGNVIDSLWDAVNAAPDKLAVIENVSLGGVIMPTFEPPLKIAHSIELRYPAGEGARLGLDQWREFIRARRNSGWELVQVEFRHNKFATNSHGQPAWSEFLFTANVVNERQQTRASLGGNIVVEWVTQTAQDGQVKIGNVDVSKLVLKTRNGPPPFQQVLCETLAPPEGSHFIDPLIVHDLDGDGFSEIILAARNQVFKRIDWDRFVSAPLCRHWPGLIFTALVADFDGDGIEDFLCAKFEGLFLFKGTGNGKFDLPPEQVWSVEPHLKYGQVLTAGDIDGDGDLDVWLGQYKGPFLRGQMPTPYYDANDGNPAYLLLNDGQGHFSDATANAGLSAKRWRRTYAGSLVDFDADGDLDLLVVSDFAGIDMYANDGKGRFTDVTDALISDRHGFGMAHTFGDFNLDGRLDFLVTGMHCPTAKRLDHLNLVRPERPDYAAMRAAMTAGNKMFFGQPDGRFALGPQSSSIALSGWSWGCSAFDCDNDLYPDVYVANGHESKESVRDYEPHFWLHDIYVASSYDDLVKAAYFSGVSARTRGHGYSYGGYDKNKLFLNREGGEFVEVAHLFGVALEEDCRNVVADDLDCDGRVDLLVTTFEAWPQKRQTLRVFRNLIQKRGNWISVRLSPNVKGCSPIGASVTIEAGGLHTTKPVVTGDSHRTQHTSQIHFGLGTKDRIDRLVVRWPDGATNIIRSPPINTCQVIHHP